MCRDIELYWGEPVESLRQRFQTELEIMNGYEHISLSNCSMKLARELIELIIAFMFHHQIPMRVETSKLLVAIKQCCTGLQLTVIVLYAESQIQTLHIIMRLVEVRTVRQ